MSSNTQHIQAYKCYIDGDWLESSPSDRIPVENPATGEVFADVSACSRSDVERALETSKKAQESWREVPPIQRASYVQAITQRLQEERDHFARLIVREQGKPLREALGEVDDTVRYLTYSAEAARRIQGDIFPSDCPNEELWIHKVPFGVTVGLCAYNYPLALIGRKVGPALVTGNTMVIKPHELTPVTASEFCRLADGVGLPRGVLNMVTGTGSEVGTLLVSSPIPQLITMTGSIRTGQAIAAAAAPHITALSLELGGKAPFIVMEDADIDRAVTAAVTARFTNCGQVCICNEVVLVHEKIADEFTEKLLTQVARIKVGDPMDDADMGPSTSRSGVSRVAAIIKKTLAEGAELAFGGTRLDGKRFEKGNWCAPTVLTEVRVDMTAMREEIFGPVLPITRVSSFEEALTIGNGREDGLSAYIWTKDYKRFMKAIGSLAVGTIFINKGMTGYIQGYHSGHKLSGLGGEDGIYGIEGYLQKRVSYLSFE